jgi:hypothetical protein
VGAECGGNGVGEGEWRVLWNMVPASRWARTKHRSVGGEELRVMMDSVGQWVYVVEMVRMCAHTMWPL